MEPGSHTGPLGLLPYPGQPVAPSGTKIRTAPCQCLEVYGQLLALALMTARRPCTSSRGSGLARLGPRGFVWSAAAPGCSRRDPFDCVSKWPPPCGCSGRGIVGSPRPASPGFSRCSRCSPGWRPGPLARPAGTQPVSYGQGSTFDKLLPRPASPPRERPLSAGLEKQRG